MVQMKSNNKKLIYFSLITVFVMAVFFSLFESFTVHAAPVSDLSDFITGGNGVTIKAAETTISDSADVPNKIGLTVKGGEGYEASINGVFESDVRLDFTFVCYPFGVVNENGASPTVGTGAGDFRFKIADSLNPSDYFEVRYFAKNEGNVNGNLIYTTTANVYYGSKIRGAACEYYPGTNNNAVTYHSAITTSGAFAYGSTAAVPLSFVGAPFWGNRSLPNTYLNFSWENDILVVTAKGANDLPVVLAKFDGTVGQEIITNGKILNGKYGLPKLENFKTNGYTVSFTSPYDGFAHQAFPRDSGNDICFFGIEADGEFTDLTRTIASSPMWYETYLDRLPVFTVSFDSGGGGTSVGAITGVRHRSKISMPTTPERQGHTFDGWYIDAEYTLPWNFAYDYVTSDVTLYAKWVVLDGQSSVDPPPNDGGRGFTANILMFLPLIAVPLIIIGVVLVKNKKNKKNKNI